MDRHNHLQEGHQVNPDNRIVGYRMSNATLVDTYTLEITFRDNEVRTINFETYLTKAAIYKRFLKPENFAKFKVDKYGYRLYWPGNTLDFHYSQLYNGLKRT